MLQERVEKVKQLMASALAKPPAEREAYLDAACAGDVYLRQEVELYLNSGEKTEQFNYQVDSNAQTEASVEIPPELLTESAGSTPPNGDDTWIGKEFGKYVIQKRLGEGGMGIVYLAVDTHLGREVALKILPQYFSMDRERLQRFHREARATSLLNHPNIVTVFDLGHHDGWEFIVTEYIEGETLRSKMEKGPIPFVEMVKITTQVAGALGAAHKAGIIHRDIKPENVMIRPDGYVKVLDFGLAKVTGQVNEAISGGRVTQQSFSHTVPGTIMGTAAYMSPEQAEGGDIDPRTDIWGLGVILYEMVAGKLPFEGPSPSHTIVAILEHAPQPFEHPSAEIRQVIATALQKDRTLRFQSAEAMSAALDESKHRLGYFSDQKIEPPPSIEKKVSKRQPSVYRKLAWIVPVALVMLLGGAIAIFAAIAFLMNNSSASNTNINTANLASPIATRTVEANSVVVSATPRPTITPTPGYVSPTPLATATPVEKEPVDRQPRPAPARTPVRVEPRKTPVKKTKQDPNCVFTNTCN